MIGNLFIITSPSGGGKGTLIRKVLPTIENLSYSVSYTTRNSRDGEIHGEHYFFVGIDEFKSLIEQKEFLEYAEVHGKFYGTSKTQVEKEISEGNDIILEIDVQGAENVQKLMPDAIGIFILPPTFEILQKRLIERQTEDEDDLFIRLNNAKKEVKEVVEFDYVIINDDVEKATENLKSIILAERQKRDRQKASISDILNSFDNC